MMARGMMVVAALGLAACVETGANRSFDDPAVQRLFTQSTPEYYASLAIATQIAQGCARYGYDAALDAELNEARNAVGRGSLSAMSLSRAIELETDVAQRSFEVKHGVTLGASELCAAGDAETLEGTAVSALLIPV